MIYSVVTPFPPQITIFAATVSKVCVLIYKADNSVCEELESVSFHQALSIYAKTVKKNIVTLYFNVSMLWCNCTFKY